MSNTIRFTILSMMINPVAGTPTTPILIPEGTTLPAAAIIIVMAILMIIVILVGTHCRSSAMIEEARKEARTGFTQRTQLGRQPHCEPQHISTCGRKKHTQPATHAKSKCTWQLYTHTGQHKMQTNKTTPTIQKQESEQ